MGGAEDVYAKTLREQLFREKQRMLPVYIVRHKQNDSNSLLLEAKRRSILAKNDAALEMQKRPPSIKKVWPAYEKRNKLIAFFKELRNKIKSAIEIEKIKK